MPRWLAVGLGCITALGMQALFGLYSQQAGAATPALIDNLVLLVALVLAGYVTGHLVGRAHVLYATLMAIVYILVTTTVQATGEAIMAHELGLESLPPIDFVQLTIVDVLAMGGASFGGWLATRL